MTVFWLALVSPSGAVSLTVTFERQTITLGESTVMALTFEDGMPSTVPVLPQIPNLNVSRPPGRVQHTSILNGVTNTKLSFTYTVIPSQPGEYTIPALTVDIGGQPYTSQPATLRVIKPGVPVPPEEVKTAFIKLIVPKTEVYVGEVLPVEIQVYFQMATGNEPPKLKEEGFTLGKMVPSQQTTAVIDNQRYNVLPIKTYVVPVKAGNVELGPATIGLTVGTQVNVFGQMVDGRSVTLQSEPQTLRVLPLPRDNVPTGFSGAVGDYGLTVSVNPTNVAVGDPVTVTVRINGRGAVEAVTLPEQSGWQPQFKVYPPTSDFEPAPNDPMGASGSKIFKLTVVPESTDIKVLPPFVFSFFNPEQKAYRALTRPAVPLIVRPSAASLPPSGLAVAPPPGSATNQDIIHIKPRLGVVAQIRPPLLARPWFLAMQALPVLAWVALFVNRRQKERLAGNPRLRRRRLVQQIVHDGLQELRRAAEANQPEKFFAMVFRLLQEQLGERLDLPASAITEAIVDERLRPLNVPEETLSLLAQLFHECNQARYARETTNEQLASLIPQVELALGEIGRIEV